MFLSHDELIEITGYQRRADQRTWLQDHGWKHEVSRTGRPVVLRAEMERHMLGQSKKKERELNMRAIAA